MIREEDPQPCPEMKRRDATKALNLDKHTDRSDDGTMIFGSLE